MITGQHWSLCEDHTPCSGPPQPPLVSQADDTSASLLSCELRFPRVCSTSSGPGPDHSSVLSVELKGMSVSLCVNRHHVGLLVSRQISVSFRQCCCD